jgi:hypothetical protein
VAGYLSLPGTSGNYASFPDAAALDITGDIDIRACIAMNDWTPAGVIAIIGKWDGVSNRSYGLDINSGSTGRPVFFWSVGGGSNSSLAGTVAPTVSDGNPLWIRGTLDVVDATSKTAAFYYSNDPITTDPASVSWTLLSSNSSITTTSIFAGNAIVELGTTTTGTANGWAGKFYYGEIRNGINGTIVASPDFRYLPPGTRSFTDAQGNLVTINGTAALVADPRNSQLPLVGVG